VGNARYKPQGLSTVENRENPLSRVKHMTISLRHVVTGVTGSRERNSRTCSSRLRAARVFNTKGVRGRGKSYVRGQKVLVRTLFPKRSRKTVSGIVRASVAALSFQRRFEFWK